MNRRAFLSLRVTSQVPTLELSCQGLYMRYLDAKAAGETVPGTVEHEAWMGEPPAALALPTTEELLHQIQEDLGRVQRLRVLESEWLESTGLGEWMASLFASFRARGGLVEFSKSR